MKHERYLMEEFEKWLELCPVQYRLLNEASTTLNFIFLINKKANE